VSSPEIGCHLSITRENFTLSVKMDKKEKRRPKNDGVPLLGFV
jgi:hypothetical protein